MTYYAVRLHVPEAAFYTREEVTSLNLLEYLEQHFDTVIIYEHYGEANDKGRTHCHLLLAHPNEAVTADAIKKSAPFKYLKLKGSEQLSFKSNFKDKKTKQVFPMDVNNIDKYITYMSKGEYDPVSVSIKSIRDLKQCEALRKEWVAAPIGKDIQTYKSFDAWLMNQPPMQMPSVTMPDSDYDWLKRNVWTYVMNVHHVFNHRAASDFRMLLVTAQFRRGIKTPEKSKAYI